MLTYKGPRRRVENVFDEITTENFLNLKKETRKEADMAERLNNNNILGSLI